MTIKVYPPQYVEELEAETATLREERDGFKDSSEILRSEIGRIYKAWKDENARLREEADHAQTNLTALDEAHHELLKERDRLRSANDNNKADALEFEAELTRLREENEADLAYTEYLKTMLVQDTVPEDVVAGTRALRDELARLREALEKIESMGISLPRDMDTSVLMEARVIARNALKETT